MLMSAFFVRLFFLGSAGLTYGGKLDSRTRAIIIALVICFLLASPAAALQVLQPAASGVPASKTLFLEHYLNANGTVIEGKSPFKTVNFPTYWYNQNTGQLNGRIDFPVNSSLIMIFGDVLTLSGNFGEGTGNKLFGVYSLPVTADHAVIYSIDRSGNVVMNVNKKTIVLKPGESYSYSANETLGERNALIEVNYTHTYVNHGFIDKNRIGTSFVPA
jgi:hypothetical protein